MSSIKQRHKLEVKQLNQECDASIQGKKGAERQAAVRAAEQRKRELFQRHQQEEANAAAATEEEPVVADTNEEAAADAPAGQDAEPKLSKARQKAKRKEEKEREERTRKLAEQETKGPTIRDREMAALAHQISALGLEVREVTPDGNCLYSAVANQLDLVTGQVETIDELRNLAANVMEQHSDLFEPFLPEDSRFADYVRSVRMNGEWGGQLELRALSMALNRPIWVHRMHTPVVKMGQEEFGEDQVLHVTFHEHQFATGEHYNSAVPRTAAHSE